MYPLTLGDENVAGSKNGSLEADFQAWSSHLATRLTLNNGIGQQHHHIDHNICSSSLKKRLTAKKEQIENE
jgi:hypothetical protein